MKVYVLDEELKPCPIWVPGEIYFSGIGVSRGYWKDEVRNGYSYPYHPITGERMHKTGDLGCILPDGNIQILGRTDFQVKIQGRI